MIKAKQKTLRIFVIKIEKEADFFPYMDKNLILLKEFFLVISGDITPKITKYLDDNGICFMIAEECKLKLNTKTKSATKSDIIEQNRATVSADVKRVTINSQIEDTIEEKKATKTLLLEKPVRSGEEIIYDGDITIFGRVNSAAKVIAEGNVEVYGTIDGLVQCDGEYMIVKDLGKGHIIFNGDILERDDFDGSLKKITLDKNGVNIKDVF